MNVDSISSLLALTALEIVLGIDNIVFIAILVGRLDPAVQTRARLIGLGLAMITRVMLLFCITWIMKLTEPLLWTLSGRDLILLGGGLFLMWKATNEMHAKIEAIDHPKDGTARVFANFGAVIAQIIMIDIIFSLDSVITAVGMAQDLHIMVAAVIIAVFIMMAFSGAISAFIERHPTLKVLALSFLIMIGALLVAESFGKHFERGYVYFAMVFSLTVELLNIRMRKNLTDV